MPQNSANGPSWAISQRNPPAARCTNIEADGDTISFKTPDEWRRADFALLPEYRDVVFDRSIRGPDAASRVMGAGRVVLLSDIEFV